MERGVDRRPPETSVASGAGSDDAASACSGGLDGLPRHLAHLWGVGVDENRGRRRRLSIEEIATAAVAIADSDGLVSVTMAAVASSLGVGTMTLYGYVDTRDDLVTVMADSVCSPPPSTHDLEPTDEGTRRWLRSWALAGVQTFVRHRWLLDVPSGSAPLLTPRAMEWTERGLDALAQIGVPAEDRFSALLVLDGAIRGAARTRAEQSGGMQAAPGALPAARATAVLLASRMASFPRMLDSLAAVQDTGSAQEHTADRTLDIAVDAVVRLAE